MPWPEDMNITFLITFFSVLCIKSFSLTRLMIAQTLSVGGHKFSEVACLFFKNKNTTLQHSNGKWTRPLA